jgi:hypothetical protein
MASPLQDQLVNAVYSENLAKHTNTLCEQNSDLSLMLKQVVHMAVITLL